jgi:glycosyltransferase involved in cell wall biosynthesis
MKELSVPHVSVIIPTYNRADLLPRALDSVLRQDYTDFELIVIDNGSTPETRAVLQKFNDPRMRCIRFERNRGVGGARNEGVRQARGKLVTFIDSDDVWLPGKLSYQVGLFERYPQIELVFGNYRNINYISRDDKSGFDQTQVSLQLLWVRELEKDVCEVLDGIPEGILEKSFFATPTVMLRAAVFGKVGNFNTTLSGPEDFEFWLRSALNGICFAYTTRLLIDRHKDAESLSSATLVFLPRYLHALDISECTARETGRMEIIPHLDRARRRTWLTLIHAHALQGHRVGAWRAFGNSLRYGFTWKACLYFAAALAGPNAIALAKQFGKHS